MNEGDEQSDLYQEQGNPAGAYDATQREPQDPSAVSDPGMVEWSASEFIDHQKGMPWFLMLAIVAAAVSILVYFATGRGIYGPVIIIILAFIFGVGAARRPRILQYQLDESGLTIGEKLYPYELFRAFSLIKEGPVESILLLPAKRWNPSISIYYAPEDADTIMNTLGSFVPFEEHQLGYTDRFLHKIRF